MAGKGPKYKSPRYFKKLKKNMIRYEAKLMVKLKNKPKVQRVLVEARKAEAAKFRPFAKVIADLREEVRAIRALKNQLVRSEQDKAKATYFLKLLAARGDELLHTKKKLYVTEAKLRKCQAELRAQHRR